MNDVAEALNFAGLKSAGLIQETYDNFIGGKCRIYLCIHHS